MRNLQLAFLSNKTTARVLNILEFIERKRVFTLGELAAENNVSERTIANDFRYLKDYLKHCAKFISGSKGYTFEETHLSKYTEQKKNLFSNECLFEIIEQVFYGEFYQIEDLAHHYNYSESTFRRLLLKTNSTLELYGLHWIANPLRIAGDEASLRKFFKDFFYEGIETPYTVVPDNQLHELFSKNGVETLGAIEVGTGTTPQAFYYTLFITIIRVSKGARVSIPNELLEKVYNEKDFFLLTELINNLKNICSIPLPKEEIAWIYLVTICKRTINQEKREKLFYDRLNLWPEIFQITKNYFSSKMILKEDKHRIEGFLNAFFLSIKINDLLSPVLNKETNTLMDQISMEYAEIFNENYTFLQKSLDKLSLSKRYLKDICASFTLYSEMILDSYSSEKTIFFLLEGNHFVCQSIRLRAIELFGLRHNLVFVPLQMLNQETFERESVDLIVTNYPRYVSDILNGRDHLLIKEVPDRQDWITIANRIRPSSQIIL